MEKIRGIVYWASVHTPNTKYNDDGIWQIDIEVDKKEQKRLKGLGLNLIKKDNGIVVFRPKRGVKRAKGDGENKPPQVFDKFGNKFSEDIGNGSECEVAFSVFPFKRIDGNGADLVAVKVIEHVPYSKDAGDIFDFEEDEDAEENPFD